MSGLLCRPLRRFFMAKKILSSINLTPFAFNYEWVQVASIAAAFREILAFSPDIVILNEDLSDGNAFDILTYLRNTEQSMPAIVLSKRHPLLSSFDDRISFLHESISGPSLQKLIEQKFTLPKLGQYTLSEYVDFAKKSLQSTEISVCRGDGEECNKIIIENGIVVETRFGRDRGTLAFKNLLKLDHVDIRFSNDSAATAVRETIPFTEKTSAGVTRMKQNAVDLRSTIGHGSQGVPFQFVNDDAVPDNETLVEEESEKRKFSRTATVEVEFNSQLLKTTSEASTMELSIFENEPEPEPKIEVPQKPLVDLSGMDVPALLDRATEEMISRHYDIAKYVLESVLEVAPDNQMALANLKRLKHLIR